jgi:threonine synthase
MAQIVYYVTSAAALGASADRPVTFVVPTGNFGNVYAGHVARRMGLPVRRLIVASNRNDILTRFFTTATMSAEPVFPTFSPSMDIQVSSNLERLLWEVLGGDGEAVSGLLGRFRAEGSVALDDERFGLLTEGFGAQRADDGATLATIRGVYERCGVLIDPHTAVALAGVLDQPRDGPVVVLATAHPAKFPDAVEQAVGFRPPLPDRLADLFERPERLEHAPAELAAVEHFVAAHARGGSSG